MLFLFPFPIRAEQLMKQLAKCGECVSLLCLFFYFTYAESTYCCSTYPSLMGEERRITKKSMKSSYWRRLYVSAESEAAAILFALGYPLRE
jgi:hypothetical protein